MAPVLAGRYGPEGLELTDGRPARNTPVSVLDANGVPATLYANKEKTTAAPNPVITDNYGNLTFLAVPGEYTLNINGTFLTVLVQIHPSDPGFGVGGEGEGGYEHMQITPQSAFQITHNLPWKPAGVDACELNGDRVFPRRVSHPATGIIELDFGFPFAGPVHLS